MPEVLTLSTPITNNRTFYQFAFLHLDGWLEGSPHMVVGVKGSDGVVLSFDYNGPQARTRLDIINRANYSVKSLTKSALEMLVTDGKIPAGSVTGSP